MMLVGIDPRFNRSRYAGPFALVGLQATPGLDPIDVRKALSSLLMWPQFCTRPGS
jgi:hypothetical protein